MPIRRDSRNGRWFFRTNVRTPEGLMKRVSGTPGVPGPYHEQPNTKVGAQEAERRAVARILNGECVRPRAAKQRKKVVPTLNEFADGVFLPKSKLENKHSSYLSKESILRIHIRPTLGDRRLDQIKYADIEDLKIRVRLPTEARKTDLSAKSANNVLTVLRSLLQEARERGVIDVVPRIKWLKTPPSTFDFLHFDEASRLVEAADGEWETMILFALRTGLRLGEILALRWDDVDLVRGQVTVARGVARGVVSSPKSGKQRHVSLSPEIVRALKAHRHLRGELVFCTGSGRMFTDNECKHPLRRACKRAGLRRVGWHKLRHSFASHLAMRGVPIKVVQELLGHATIEMTMRYAHLAPEVKHDAVALLDQNHDGEMPAWQRGGSSGKSSS